MVVESLIIGGVAGVGVVVGSLMAKNYIQTLEQQANSWRIAADNASRENRHLDSYVYEQIAAIKSFVQRNELEFTATTLDEYLLFLIENAQSLIEDFSNLSAYVDELQRMQDELLDKIETAGTTAQEAQKLAEKYQKIASEKSDEVLRLQARVLELQKRPGRVLSATELEALAKLDEFDSVYVSRLTGLTVQQAGQMLRREEMDRQTIRRTRRSLGKKRISYEVAR